jgi:hypothetical protein
MGEDNKYILKSRNHIFFTLAASISSSSVSEIYGKSEKFALYKCTKPQL